MERQTELASANPMRSVRGPAKFLQDVLSILEMKLHLARQGWQWYLLGALIFPLGMFYWSRALVPDDPEAVRRLMTGTIIFGVSIMTANSLSDQLVQDRFQGRLKLLITMPMSKAAYAIGVLAFASIQSAAIMALLLAFGFIAGVDFDPTPAFVLVIIPMLLTMAGFIHLPGQPGALRRGRRHRQRSRWHPASHDISCVLHDGTGALGATLVRVRVPLPLRGGRHYEDAIWSVRHLAGVHSAGGVRRSADGRRVLAIALAGAVTSPIDG